MIMCLSFIIYHFSFSHAVAQVKVESSLSAVEMLVGQQVQVTVTATTGENAVVEFPKETMLPAGIEFLGAVEMPTEKVDGGQVNHSRGYVFTSFDDTLYYIPPFTIKVDGKNYQTNKLALKVLTVDVDTTDFEKYYGPKTVQDNPFSWELDQWAVPFWLSVLMLVLMAVAWYLWLRLRDNKPVIARPRFVRRLLPHQKAMRAIEEIKAEKMQTAEDPKEYYTRLTDTLRKYIEERYGFYAMEMTSSEIIEKLTQADPESLDELRSLFQTADLVKFAKYSTLLGENDANLVSAIDFINRTKVELPPSEQVVKTELTEEEKQTKKSRTTLKTAIAVLCIAAAVLFGYIIYSVIDLL
ncbi:MAG: hypothetical protein J6Z14_02330 [Prevotella sp.]|nr:hypothetical protein [Prevotella sp.]